MTHACSSVDATCHCSPLQALLAFVGDCADTALLEDVLSALADLLRHTPGGRVPHLAGAGGAQLFLNLLSREQPGLRVLGLRLLTHFLPYLHAAKGARHVVTGGDK